MNADKKILEKEMKKTMSSGYMRGKVFSAFSSPFMLISKKNKQNINCVFLILNI